MVELAAERRRFGYRRLHVLLRREGLHANHKRVFRLYQGEGLAVPKRKRRRGVAVAYAEALFRTAKYRPEFPARGFDDLDAARAWAANFVPWYNVEHRHSGIRYVSPAQRHAGDDHAILAARHALYLAAREANPARWRRQTRNWSPIRTVMLNPERDRVIGSTAAGTESKRLAA